MSSFVATQQANGPDAQFLIETRNLTMIYEDGYRALHGLNLHVAAGEIYALVGANGAGKTTTIHLLLGLIKPTGGAAFINGYLVTQGSLAVSRSVAYVPEQVQLYPNLTALEILEFFSQLYGQTGLKQRDLIETLVESGLEESTAKVRVKHLSKGTRQKLGLAVAMLKGAPVLLLDEPTSGLDSKSADELMSALWRQRSQGKAILLVMHDLFRAQTCADRIGFMNGGTLVAECTPEQLAGSDLNLRYLEYIGREAAAAHK